MTYKKSYICQIHDVKIYSFHFIYFSPPPNFLLIFFSYYNHLYIIFASLHISFILHYLFLYSSYYCHFCVIKNTSFHFLIFIIIFLYPLFDIQDNHDSLCVYIFSYISLIFCVRYAPPPNPLHKYIRILYSLIFFVPLSFVLFSYSSRFSSLFFLLSKNASERNIFCISLKCTFCVIYLALSNLQEYIIRYSSYSYSLLSQPFFFFPIFFFFVHFASLHKYKTKYYRNLNHK